MINNILRSIFIVSMIILGGCARSTKPEPVPTITLIFSDSVPPDDWPFEIDEVIMSCTLWIDFSDSTRWQKKYKPVKGQPHIMVPK